MKTLRLTPKLKFIVFVSILAAGFQNCSKVGFQNSASSSTASASVTTDGASCTSIASVSRLTKILFVVDTSGSNVIATTDDGTISCSYGSSSCTPATDPQKTFRAGAINTFFQTYQSKTNFQWSFETFSNDHAKSLMSDGAVFGLAGAMSTAITAFNRSSDVGDTPYQAALNLARTTIANDSDLHSADEPQYVVVFLSDGYPTDFGSGSSDLAEADAAIDSLVAIAPGRITFSSIYYGQVQDASAIALLQGMATRGSGQFANAQTSTSAFSINDVIPGTVCN